MPFVCCIFAFILQIYNKIVLLSSKPLYWEHKWNGGEGGIMSYEDVSCYISISYAVYSPSLYNFCTISGQFTHTYKMKSVDKKLDLCPSTMSLIIFLLTGPSLAATSVLIENTFSASDTERVPSAESFLPVNGNVSGPL